jgi:hypothetical protein
LGGGFTSAGIVGNASLLPLSLCGETHKYKKKKHPH